MWIGIWTAYRCLGNKHACILLHVHGCISYQTCSCDTGTSWALSLYHSKWCNAQPALANQGPPQHNNHETPLQWLFKSGRQRETGIFLPRFTYYGSHLQHWVFDRLKLVGFFRPCRNGKEQLMRIQLDHLRMAHFQVWFSEMVWHLTVEMLVRKTCGMQDENNAGAIQSRLQF